MTDSPIFCLTLAALCGLSSPLTLHAHGGPEVPLYVAEDGIDSGNCDRAEVPCATIAYALGKAGKGTEIRVAEGTYEIATTEDLFHLLSDVVTVTGGYRSPASPLRSETARSTLTGVPAAYRSELQERGFHVIADRKGIEGPRAAEAERLLSLRATMQSSLPHTPCVNGDAGGLACDSVDLVAHVPFANLSATVAASNDIWGFVDLNTHREYVIMGFNNGTAVFDVSDAENPAEIGFVPGQNAVWRDIKVFQYFDTGQDRWMAYAYVTTDGVTDGMIVIDLTGLPHFIVKRSYISDFTAAHNVYLSNTDSSTGLPLNDDGALVIVAGANVGDGRYRAYSLDNPAAPSFVADAPIVTDRYMHDAASLLITDARKDAYCVNATTTHCNVLLDFNENTIVIWDITDPANPTQLSSTPYANASYVHSGWWSEDSQYMFVHDELDEQAAGLPTTLRVFSLGDLSNPQLVGQWSGPTTAIDHNGFVRGNRYYMSNYARGLTILDISDPTAPFAAGRLDTYPFSDGSTFVGAWGVYPFLPSGTIAVSDIDSGLYLASDQTRDVAEGKLSFAAASFAAVEGTQAVIPVQRSGGTSGVISVDWEVLNATAAVDDLDPAGSALARGTLSWADGDAADKSIALGAASDGDTEGLEFLIVRLTNPVGGASLDNVNQAYVYLSDPGTATEIGFASGIVTVAENDGVAAIITVARSGSAVGASSVEYNISAGDAVAGVNFEGSTSGTLSWADGDARPQTLVYRILDDGQNNASSFLELSLSNASGGTVTGNAVTQLVIEDGAGSNVTPVANAGGSQTLDESTAVTLDGSQSSDPDGTSLQYEWTQTSGVQVALQNADTAIASFTAPAVASDAMLQFNLTVYDNRGATGTSSTTVTVINTDPVSSGGGGGNSGGGALGWLFLVILQLLFMRSGFPRCERGKAKAR